MLSQIKPQAPLLVVPFRQFLFFFFTSIPTWLIQVFVYNYKFLLLFLYLLLCFDDHYFPFSRPYQVFFTVIYTTLLYSPSDRFLNMLTVPFIAVIWNARRCFVSFSLFRLSLVLSNIVHRLPITIDSTSPELHSTWFNSFCINPLYLLIFSSS